MALTVDGLNCARRVPGANTTPPPGSRSRLTRP